VVCIWRRRRSRGRIWDDRTTWSPTPPNGNGAIHTPGDCKQHSYRLLLRSLTYSLPKHCSNRNSVGTRFFQSTQTPLQPIAQKSFRLLRTVGSTRSRFMVESLLVLTVADLSEVVLTMRRSMRGLVKHFRGTGFGGIAMLIYKWWFGACFLSFGLYSSIL